MTPDQIREVFRQALRDGDLHEGCDQCQERIDAAIAGYLGADRVLRAVYVWCAMAAACRRTSQMTCDRHEDSAEPVWS